MVGLLERALQVSPRICNRCGETKDYRAFRRSKTGRDGLTAACKDCLNSLQNAKRNEPWVVPLKLPPAKLHCSVKCFQCGKQHTRTVASEKFRIKRGMMGPFCSRRCTALWKAGRGAEATQFRRILPDVECAHCGVTFHPYIAGRKFHSRQCWKEALQLRRQPIASPSEIMRPPSVLDLALREALGTSRGDK